MACCQNVWRFDGKYIQAMSLPASKFDLTSFFIDFLPLMGSDRRLEKRKIFGGGAKQCASILP